MSDTATPTRREALLSSAASLFRERGYFGVGIHEIGNAAGIVGSGVYRHFESKEAILVALTDQTVDGLIAGAPRSGPTGVTASGARRTRPLPPGFALDQRNLIAVYLGEERNLGDHDRKRLGASNAPT